MRSQSCEKTVGLWDSLKGDLPGHPFRGNQWSGGSGILTSSDVTGLRSEDLSGWKEDAKFCAGMAIANATRSGDPIEAIVGRVDGELVGIMSWTYNGRSLETSDALSVDWLATKRTGEGLGAEMMQAVCRKAAGMGKGVELEATDTVIKFYEKFGMTDVGRNKMTLTAEETKAIVDAYKSWKGDLRKLEPSDGVFAVSRKQKPSRLAIAKQLLSVATQAVQLKQALLKDQLRTAVAKEVHVKQYEETERELAESIADLIKRQYASASKTVKGDGSSGFDPRDWDDDLVNTALPILMKHAGQAAAAQMLMMGVDVAPRGKRTKGDYEGHPFRGNQWSGKGKSDVPPLPKVKVVDISSWPAHNSSAKSCAKKIAMMEALADNGDIGALADAYKPPAPGKQQNGYQKKVGIAHEKLMEQAKEKLGGGIDQDAASQKWDASDPNVGLMDGYEKVGGKLGTVPGGTYITPDGTKVYAKFPKNEDVARSEVLADKLYKLAGASVVDAGLVKNANGDIGVATKWEETEHADWNNSDVKSAAAKDFAIHAWLGNWDCIGAGSENPEDNIRVTSDGKMMVIDSGGSMEYKGTGGKKPAGSFGEDVSEWDTLRNPSINPSAAKVFGDMTPDQLIEAGNKLAGIKTEEIRDLVEKYYGGSQAEKDAMVDLLDARRASIAARVADLESAKQGGPPKQSGDQQLVTSPTGDVVASEPVPPVVPQPPTITSKSNAHMQNKLNQLFEAAKTGDMAAVEAIKTNPDSKQTYTKMQHQYKMSLLAAMGQGGTVSDSGGTSEPPPVSTKINASLFPDSPVFTSSNAANVASNMAAVSEAIGLAESGDLEALKSMNLPQSPKLNQWHQALVANVNAQMHPPPPLKSVDGTIDEIASKVGVCKGPGANKIGSYLVIGESGSIPHDAIPQGIDMDGDWKAGKKSFDALPEAMQKSVRGYTGSGFVKMNESLRSHKPTPSALRAANGVMQASIDLPPGMRLSRGHGLSDADVELLTGSVGKVIQDPGIISTSTGHGFSGKVSLNLVVGHGVKGLPAKSFSKHSSENEVILPPNTRMLVTSVTKKEYATHVDAVVLPFDSNQCCPP